MPGRRAREYLEARDPGIARPMGRVAARAYAGLLWVALILVVASSFATTQRVTTRSEAAALGFGFPVHYVIVDRTWEWGAAGGPQGPFEARFNPWEEQSMDLRPGAFLLDWALVGALLWAPLWLVRRSRS